MDEGHDEKEKGLPAERQGWLSPDKERLLWHRMIHEGDDQAREDLVIAYRPLVFWLAKRFQVRPSSWQDLIQEGMVALIEAVDNFEPERHLRFTTYGFYRIRGQMVNFLQRSEKKAPIPVEEQYLQPGDSGAEDGFETLFTLSEYLHRLPEKEEFVVSELFVEGQSARDVAKKLGMDVSHIHRLKRSGLSKLREWLLREG